MSRPAPLVKICGIRRLADARRAAKLGADALGFIFARESPRRTSLRQAWRIVKNLAPRPLLFGVFVNASFASMARAADLLALDYIQLHGEEPPELLARLARELSAEPVKAFRLAGARDLEALADYPGRTYLLERFVPGKRGGTGVSFNWRLAALARRYGRVILSGGLTPLNVRAAIATARPWMVDVASGVEVRPGVKDPARMERFIRAAKDL